MTRKPSFYPVCRNAWAKKRVLDSVAHCYDLTTGVVAAMRFIATVTVATFFFLDL